MAKAKTEEDTRTQRQKFIDTAREHDADGGADAFRAPFARLRPSGRWPKRPPPLPSASRNSELKIPRGTRGSGFGAW